MTDISVIILTFNEEANLGAALDSVRRWAKEVFVVDSYSTDRTVDIALERAADGVRVVQHAFEDYSKQWNWAVERLPIGTEWVLKLDADERVTPEFKEEFGRVVSDPANDYVAYYFRRRFIFMGRHLRWGGMFNNWDVRLWKHAYGRFEDRPCNEHVVIRGGKVGRMGAAVDHHSAKDLAAWIEKQNRYTTLEAAIRLTGRDGTGTRPRLLGGKAERSKWFRRTYYRLPLRPLVYFFVFGMLKGAFLDGRPGMRYAILRSIFLYLNDLKVIESRAAGRLPQVPPRAHGKPHPQVASSEIQKFVDGRKQFNALAPGVSFPWIDKERSGCR